MPRDPRQEPKVLKLAAELKELEHDDFVKKLRQVKDDDAVGWTRYAFQGHGLGEKPWQVVAINRWLERDKFTRNVRPQWIGTVFGILGFVVSLFALYFASR